jgi:Holliday junction DNA helicase RuvA
MQGAKIQDSEALQIPLSTPYGTLYTACMIGSLSGTVRGLIRDTVVIDVGGVGYRVAVPVATLARVSEGENAFLWTHLAVRENSQDLYGFETREELHWFELLLTVSGIGPKSALGIMNAVDPASLEQAIARGDAATLTKTFGLGKKSAEKIVLELREKAGGSEAADTGSDGDVVEALIGLGYSLREARDAVHAIPKDAATPEARLREALKLASRSK